MELIEMLIAVFVAAGLVTALDSILSRNDGSLPWEPHRRHERVKQHKPKHPA